MNRILGAILLVASLSLAGDVNFHGSNKVKVVDVIDIRKQPTVVIDGTVLDWNMKALVKELTAMGKIKTLNIILDSPGGSVSAGLHFINKLEKMRAAKKVVRIDCYIEGIAMSMAAIISSYCDNNLIHKFGSFMHHEASYGVEGSQSEILERVKYSEAYLKSVFDDVAKNYNLTPWLFKSIIGKERFFMGDEAIKHGFLDTKYNVLLHSGVAPEKPKSKLSFLFGTLD